MVHCLAHGLRHTDPARASVLVAYRDQGDAYVTKVFALSEDLDAVYKDLQSFVADGGGDGPEAVQVALADAVDKMKWSDSKRAAKMILVGDAPAHSQDQAPLLAASKRAIARGIVVNTVRCGGDAVVESQFREVARLADGRFYSIDQRGGVVAIATPFDDELLRSSTARCSTPPSTPAAARPRPPARCDAANQRPSPRRPPPTASASSRSQGVRAAGRARSAAPPDRRSREGRRAEDRSFPAPMKALNQEERVEYAKKQQAQRKEVAEKIAAVSKKRDAFLNSQAKVQKDSFDGRVFESVKTAAARAGVAY